MYVFFLFSLKRLPLKIMIKGKDIKQDIVEK